MQTARNLADPNQVKEGEKAARAEHEQWLTALRLVLSTKEGRLVWWALMAHAGVFKSIWEPSAKIHYNAGLQDFGHFLQAQATEADQEAYLLMQRESMKREAGESNG